MAITLRHLALLFSGAIASVLGSALFQPISPDVRTVVAMAAALFILLICGSGSASWLLHRYNVSRRKGNIFVAPKLGILNDMGWDPKNPQISAWTSVSPTEWQRLIENRAEERSIRLRVELINVRKKFDSYIAILNPYGGVYPESDVTNFQTMNNIVNFVNEGGLFVNVADVPGYYSYSRLLGRRLDTTRPVYAMASGDHLVSIRPFEQTPLMERLGLRVLNLERANRPFMCDLVLVDNFGGANAPNTAVHRAAVVERNVDSIVEPHPFAGEPVTPIFFVNYGKGRFLFSLVFENYVEDNVGNRAMRDVLSVVVVTALRVPNVEEKA